MKNEEEEKWKKAKEGITENGEKGRRAKKKRAELERHKTIKRH